MSYLYTVSKLVSVFGPRLRVKLTECLLVGEKLLSALNINSLFLLYGQTFDIWSISPAKTNVKLGISFIKYDKTFINMTFPSARSII
jgi:hypothetical protein